MEVWAEWATPHWIALPVRAAAAVFCCSCFRPSIRELNPLDFGRAPHVLGGSFRAKADRLLVSSDSKNLHFEFHETTNRQFLWKIH